MLTIKDLENRPEGTFYTGPLELAKDFIRKMSASTETCYTKYGKVRYSVYLSINAGDGEEANWDNCNDFGNGDTPEEAWRYALGGEFGPANDEFSAFPLTHITAEAVRVLVAHHFPNRMHTFHSSSTANAIVIDEDNTVWEVFPDGTLKVYRA
jgi:hypothetical protein